MTSQEKNKTTWDISISCCLVQRHHIHAEEKNVFFLTPTFKSVIIVLFWQSLNNQGSKGLMEIKFTSFQFPVIQGYQRSLSTRASKQITSLEITLLMCSKGGSKMVHRINSQWGNSKNSKAKQLSSFWMKYQTQRWLARLRMKSKYKS